MTAKAALNDEYTNLLWNLYYDELDLVESGQKVERQCKDIRIGKDRTFYPYMPKRSNQSSSRNDSLR